MERDMELIRKILFVIELKYVDEWLDNSELNIEGYDMKKIAYHCDILKDANLVSDYNDYYTGDGLYYFGVGRLTWEGHELLDKIKSDTVWKRTKDTITTKGIPFVLDAVKQIATAVTSELIKSAIQGT